MSLPLPVTEDTPPDMLAGAMDLHVVLPNGQDMKMSVERSTPMMDLLVQVTTANKISPGGHVIQAIGDRGILPYKPSTPIGALETWTIHIVPKKKAGNVALKTLPKPLCNTPFEQTFRLQVNLPRNQLYVSRVSYKTRLEDILSEVCKEKNLDPAKYCFTHPDKPDEELDLCKTFLEHKLQQVTLVSKTNRPVGLSSVDVIALKRYDNRNQNVKYYASHSYEGSVSSGSMEGRSLSPVRSDESSSSPTIPKTSTILNRPFRKRRPAPKPPSMQNGQETKQVDSLTISHSRNSSDSSGYHESSVLSESPESNNNSLADSLPRRSKLTEHSCKNRINQVPNAKIGSNLSRSLSNLTMAADGKHSKMFLSNGMRPKEYSASSMSLASIPGRKKKAPAPPPPVTKSLLSLKEEDVPNGHVCNDVNPKSKTLPPTNKLTTFCDAELICSKSRLQDTIQESTPPPSVDSCSVNPPVEVDSVSVSPTDEPDSAVKDKELTMDDEEIDRIFHDATKDYETPSLPTLPSPPKLANGVDEKCEDPYNWEYKLPSPPRAFRDQSNSPSVTEYDTVTLSNLTDVVNEKRLSPTHDKTDVLINNYKNTLYNQEHQATQTSNELFNNNHSPIAEKFKHEAPIAEDFIEKSNKITLNGHAYTNSKPEGNKIMLNCDKTPYIDVNFMCTNDSGLGSDESIPSVSESRSCVDETAFLKKNPVKVPERRGSTLQNFTITTYQNSKPTEIFHDDSVKTSKTTQLAINKHPYIKLNEKPNGLSRHSSFNKEKTPNSAVKRSKSHISLLSGNFAKFNKFGKLNVKEDDSEQSSPVYLSTENIQTVEDAPKAPIPNLRKTLSEISINKDANRGEEELLELQDQVMKWKENEKKSNTLNNMKNVSELQSLQILKDILPQIHKPQVPEKQNIVITDSADSNKTRFKIDIKTKPDHPPAVNLQSWNERPKRQVSIKTDRDYVFGNVRRYSDLEKQEMKSENREVSSENSEVSHVPIVRAVEFKKPFAQQVKLDDTYFKQEPKTEKPKPRPASCYLFGEHLGSRSQTYLNNGISEVEQKNCNGESNHVSRTKITFNCTPRTYKSVTEIKEEKKQNGHPEKECYTFRNYKIKLMENDKVNGDRFKSPLKEELKNLRRKDEVKEVVTTKSVGIPPPPPVMPPLKPVSQRINAGRKICDENPRDLLLSSIKNFNRDNLRKLRVK